MTKMESPAQEKHGKNPLIEEKVLNNYFRQDMVGNYIKPCAETSQTASLIKSFKASMVFFKISPFSNRASNIFTLK